MILLIGHGYVAEYIKRELEAVSQQFRWVRYVHKHHDETLWDVGADDPIEFIINAAGYTGVPNVDACEILENRQKCIDGNVTFPLSLEHWNIPILHITSGCVYDGYPPGGYTEKDVPNFNFGNGSFYSGSKALFQELWRSNGHGAKSYLFRIRMPFGPDRSGKNLITKLVKYDKLIDKLNSVSYLPDVARAAVYFALNHEHIPKGIYNAVNPEPIRTSDIAELFELDKTWMSDAEFKQVTVAPRSNCVLNPAKMESYFNWTPTTEALQQVKDYYERH